MAEKKENFEKMRREVEDSKTRLEQDEHQLIRTENKIAKLGKIERSRRTHMLCTKAGDMEHDVSGFRRCCENLLAAGAQTLVLGCTELPLAFSIYKLDHPNTDPTLELALAAIRFVGKKTVEHGGLL